jgi:hypothetical protein
MNNIMTDQSIAFAKRVLNVLKTEGLKGFSRRVNNRLRSQVSYIHLFVLSSEFGLSSDISAFPTGSDPLTVRALERAQRFLSSLEFKQLTMADIGEIDELTDIDPWHIPKSVILEQLQDDWHCYIAKYKGHIAACSWTKSGPEFYEPHLKRSFTLAEDEVYSWRSFCAPSFRGRGVFPWHINSVTNHLAQTTGLKRQVGLVRVKNEAMWRSLLEAGWSVVGRAGFMEFFGFRLHYMWGQKAFGLTKRRFFIQRQ